MTGCCAMGGWLWGCVAVDCLLFSETALNSIHQEPVLKLQHRRFYRDRGGPIPRRDLGCDQGILEAPAAESIGVFITG